MGSNPGDQEAQGRGPGFLRSTTSLLERSTAARYATAFLFFLLATAAWYWPMVAHLRSSVLMGPADSTLSIRSYWAIDRQGGGPFSFAHDYLNGAPEGIPYYRAVAIAQPVQTAAVWATFWFLGFIGAFNLFLLSGVVLTGFFAFVLLDRLAFHPLVGLFGGYVLAFNPWSFMRAFAGHAAFLHVWIYLAMIMCLLEMSRTRKARWAMLAGLSYGFSFLISSYFGLLGSAVVGVYFVFEFARQRNWPERLWTMTLACVALAVAVVLEIPGIVAYYRDHATVARSIGNPTVELQRLGASSGAYILPARNHPVFGPITRHFTSSANFAEQTLFFGYTTIVLAIVGLVLVVRRHPETTATQLRRWALVFAAILLPVAYWASLRRVVYPLGVPVPGLSFFLGYVTTFFRVYARFGVIVGICLVLLAAPALDRIVRRWRHGIMIGLALWALVAFELLPGRVVGWRGAAQPPAYDRWLADAPAGIVAHYPMLTDQEPAIHLGEREIYFQMFHGQPLYNLFGAGTGGTREDAIRILSRYITDPNTPKILASENVRYVFVHDDVYREQGQAPPVVPRELKLIKRFPGVRAYELRRNVQKVNLDGLLEQNAVPIAAVEGLRAPTPRYAGFGPSDTAGRRSFRDGAQLTFDNRDVNLKRIQLVVHLQSVGTPQTVQLVDATGGVAAQSVIEPRDVQVNLGPFPLPQGESTYTLRLSGGSGAKMLLGSMFVQPVADFSVSLRARN